MERTLTDAQFIDWEDAVSDLQNAVQALIDGDSLDLDHDVLRLDTADPLVAKVEAFVKWYRKLYGSPVK